MPDLVKYDVNSFFLSEYTNRVINSKALALVYGLVIAF